MIKYKRDMIGECRLKTDEETNGIRVMVDGINRGQFPTVKKALDVAMTFRDCSDDICLSTFDDDGRELVSDNVLTGIERNGIAFFYEKSKGGAE